MTNDETSRTDRRTFLQAGALATAAAAGASIASVITQTEGAGTGPVTTQVFNKK